MISAPGLLLALALALALAGAIGGAAAAARAADRADGPEDALVVFAPSSLTDAADALATAFAARGCAKPLVSIGSTPELARQVLAGAPADVFISADEAWMDELARSRAIVPESRTVVARNLLVVVVPADAPRTPSGPADLRDGSAFRRIGVAGEAVPAGRYGRAALASSGVLDAIAPRLLPLASVRACLAAAERGEVDAAIVYATDALAARRVREAFAFPGSTHPPIRLVAAVVRGSPRAETARAYVAFLRAPEGVAVLARAGFLPPASAPP